jgi:hypothetical protein
VHCRPARNCLPSRGATDALPFHLAIFEWLQLFLHKPIFTFLYPALAQGYIGSGNFL